MLAPPVKSGPRFDFMIQAEKVRVIDENGENLGVMYTKEAIEQANELGLNLVEVSPNADPPVVKFLDVGKYRYEAQKKANLARKSQKTQQIKEIKMRPNIDDHDYDVKMRSVVKFIEEGDKVKMTLRFRGREMAHQELGMNLLKRVQDDVAEIAKIEAYPRLEGRQAGDEADTLGRHEVLPARGGLRVQTHNWQPPDPGRRQSWVGTLNHRLVPGESRGAMPRYAGIT